MSVFKTLIGIECDGIVTYDHLVETDSPTTRQYNTMLKAALKDVKKLQLAKVKHTFKDGKSNNEIGLPYIEIK